MAKANRKNEEISNEEEIVMVGPPEPTKEELMARIAELEAKLEAKSLGGRKAQVLEYLQKNGHCRVSSIAAALGISDRNVSSQMTYLRADGHSIATDSRGYKFLEVPPAETE